MDINVETLRHVKACKIFKESNGRVKSIDIHKVDNFMITSGEDDVLHVYNIDKGNMLNVVNSQKYGASHACFTHHNHAVIHASTKGEDLAIRYLSLYDNRYMRYFSGHTQTITSLCVSPNSDMFLSSSKDRTVRLWDLKSEKCLGICQTPSDPCAAFDYQGLIYALACEQGIIKMYDIKEYQKGPFTKFELRAEITNQNNPVTCLKFSYDGFKLLAVIGNTIYVINTFSGDLVNKFHTSVPSQTSKKEELVNGFNTKMPKEAAFTPDGKYVISGCDDHNIRVWDIESGIQICVYEGVHQDVPAQLKWASNKFMIASACYGVVLWMPDLQSLPAHYLLQHYEGRAQDQTNKTDQQISMDMDRDVINHQAITSNPSNQRQ